eukprot:14209169-Alexandrium_andersonii.AAC.1
MRHLSPCAHACEELVPYARCRCAVSAGSPSASFSAGGGRAGHLARARAVASSLRDLPAVAASAARSARVSRYASLSARSW